MSLNKSGITFLGMKITWRRITQVITTLFLLLLMSPMTSLLNLKTAGLQKEIALEKFERERLRYFQALEKDLNDLFDELNYTSLEYQAKYSGKGKILPYEDWLNPDTSEYSFGLDPRKALVENWVRIGRMVILNGIPQFIGYNYATNGTHMAPVLSFKKGQEYVNLRAVYYIDYFINDLIQNAHPRIDSLNDLAASIIDCNYRADKFEKLFKKALNDNRKGNLDVAEQSFKEAALYFNKHLSRNELTKHFRAIVEVNKETGLYEFNFGRFEFQNHRVIGSKNQTSAKSYTFVETFEYDRTKNKFKIKKGLGDSTLTKDDKKDKSFRELFSFINKTSFNYKLKNGSIKVKSSSGLIDSTFTTKSYEQGAVNTYNYQYWDEELLSVAVVSDWTSGETKLPKLLEDAIELDVYGFLDKFSFGNYGSPATNWKEILLSEELRIEHYDVLIIDDYNVDTWNPAWDLDAKQKQILAEWLYAGGSLYLSSAYSNTESIVKDKFFPAEWIQMKIHNVVADGHFSVEKDPIDVTGQTTHTPLTFWDTFSDTPVANLFFRGEFANVWTYDGLIPASLRMGVIDELEYGCGPGTYDCPSPDKSIAITQEIQVPTTFARVYFTLQYKKLTELETDKLEVFILDDDNKEIFHRVLVSNQDSVDQTWQSLEKIDFTQALRPYAGDVVYLSLRVTGDPLTKIVEKFPVGGPAYIGERKIYSDFMIDNIMLSFLGDKSTTPIYVYHDEELMNSIDSDEYGSWMYPSGNNYQLYPYYSVDEYRSRYFADELINELRLNGMHNIQKINTKELEQFLEYEQAAILIPAHPFPRTIYDGTPTCPIIDWVFNKGGVLFDIQAEPLAYYFDYANNLVRINEADLAILGYDLFKTYQQPDPNYEFTIYNENFDDTFSSFVVTGEAEIILNNYIGGYLSITDAGRYQDSFSTPLIIRDGLDFENANMTFHASAYLQDTTKFIIYGVDENGTELRIECTLGADDLGITEDGYISTEENILYLTIPFDSFYNPSELLKGKWNTIMFNLDMTKKTLGKEFYSINRIEIITTCNETSVDNIWIGYAGSTYQTPNDWFIETLTPFVSDYPLSLKVLYDMQNYGNVDFSIFGRSEAVRKIRFFDDFDIEYYPQYDDWTENSIIGWDINSENVTLDILNSCCGNSSVLWQLPQNHDGTIAVNFLEADINRFTLLRLALKPSINITSSDWYNPNGIDKPRIVIYDTNNNSLNFFLNDDISDDWNDIILEFSTAFKEGAFDYSKACRISIYLPELPETYLMNIDHLHFETGLSKRIWNWDGLVSLIDGFLFIQNDDNPFTFDEATIHTYETFGLGIIEFNALFSANSNVEFGLFGQSESAGDFYFHYKGFDEYWWHPDWEKRKILHIDPVENVVIDYPIKLIIPRELEMQEDGEDLRFVWGVAELPFEVVSFDENYIRVWLKIPILYTDGTEVLMYYGNDKAVYNKEKYEAVWNENFASVIHFDELNGQNDPAWHFDSTYHDNYAREWGVGYDAWYSGFHEECIRIIAESYGYAKMFYDDIDTNLHLDDQFTIEACINPTNIPFDHSWRSTIVGKVDESISSTKTFDLFYTYIDPPEGPEEPEGPDVLGIHAAVWKNGVRYICGITELDTNLDKITPGSWMYLSATYDNNALKLYINGVLVASIIVGNDLDYDDDVRINIGKTLELTDDDSFVGKIDEVRISTIARDESWFAQTFDCLYGLLEYSFEIEEIFLPIAVEESDWWNDNWQYRQEITINNPNVNDLTNYQLRVVLGSEDTPFNYLTAQSDADDLRFIQILEGYFHELDYWIESWNPAGESIVWVESPLLEGETETSIFLYSGNSAAVSKSNSETTFLAWDDFDDYSLNENQKSSRGWSTIIDDAVAVPNPSGEGMVLQIWSVGNLHYRTGIVNNWVDGHEVIIQYDIMVNNKYGYIQTKDDLTWQSDIGIRDNYRDFMYYSGGYQFYSPPCEYSLNEWQNHQLYVTSYDHWIVKDDSSNHLGVNYQSGVDGVETFILYAYCLSYDSKFYIDNFHVRTYAAVEPTFEFSQALEVNPEIESWFKDGWAFRKKIDIAVEVDPPMENYDSYAWITVNLDSETFDYSKTNRDDIRFTDVCGNSLNYVIDKWNPQGTSTFIVESPFINSLTPTIFMYYGKSVVDPELGDFYYSDTFDYNLWDHHNRFPPGYPEGIYVDTLNSRMTITTNREWTNEWSYDTQTAQLEDDWELQFRYNPRQISLLGTIYIGVSSWCSGTIDTSYQTNGIYLYHYGGSTSTNSKPTFRLMVEANNVRSYSPDNFSWQPDAYSWYQIKIKRESDIVTLEIWDDNKSSLLQSHTLGCSGIAQLKYLYVTGYFTNSNRYLYGYVDDLSLIGENNLPTNQYSVSTFYAQEANMFNKPLNEVSFLENGSPLNDWEIFQPVWAFTEERANHIFSAGFTDIWRGSEAIVDTDIYALMNYESETISGTSYCYSKTSVDLTDWDGITDIPISFRFRATSDFDSSSVTNFHLAFYNAEGGLIPYGGFTASTENPNGLNWLEGKDSGWQIVSYVLSASDFNAYQGQTIQVAFGHQDLWSAWYHQRSYLDYLVIGDTVLFDVENTIEVVVSNGEVTQAKIINMDGGFNPTMNHMYKIDRTEDYIAFYIDDFQVAYFDTNLPFYNPLYLEHVFGLRTFEGLSQIDSVKITQNRLTFLSGYVIGDDFLDDFNMRSPFLAETNDTSLNDWFEVFGMGRLSLNESELLSNNWWDEDWQFREELTITNSQSVDLVDYQVKIELEVQGENSFEYLKANADGSDIRFTDDSLFGQKLNYWLEEWNSTGTSTLWVKIPFIPAESLIQIYLYYGNPLALSESNGKNVFGFFDGFDSSGFDSDTWSSSSSNGFSLENDYLEIINGSIFTKFPVGVQSGYIVEAKVQYSGSWTGYSGLSISEDDHIHSMNNPAHKLLMLISGSTNSYLNYYAADGLVDQSYNLGSGQLLGSLNPNNWYILSEILNSSSTILQVNRGEESQILSGSWESDFHIILGFFTGSLAGTADCSDIAVDWVLTRQYSIVEPTLTFGLKENYSSLIYYNDHIIIDFQENMGDMALTFEYNGDISEPPLAEGIYTRIIERRIQFMTDFTATIPITWWQAGLTSGRSFSIEFCNYNDGEYSPIALASLVDEDASGTGSFLVDSFTGTSQTTSAPLSGDALVEISRVDDLLTVSFKDSTTHVAILSDQNNLSDSLFNCIRLQYTGLWGEAMEGETSYPSHSKVWLDYIDISSDSSNDLSEITFDLINDIYVDPVALSFGRGYFCFVKNTPIKPYTVSSSEESKTAIEWIIPIIEQYLVNKIEPSFDFYWSAPDTGGFSINPYSDYAQSFFDQPYQLDAMDTPLNGVINPITLSNYESTLCLRSDLTYVDTSQTATLDNGYLENWIINIYNDYGLDVEYPDLSVYGVQEGSPMYGSSLFRTTFDDSLWNYDFDNDGDVDAADKWQIIDFGREDFLLNETGLVYDPYITNDFVLQLGEYSAAYDPGFFTEGTLNDYYSPHFMFYAEDFYYKYFAPTAPEDPDWEIHSYLTDYTGDPAPSALYYNYMSDEGTYLLLGTTIPVDVLKTLYYENNVREWNFEFDYWIGNTTLYTSEKTSLLFFRRIDGSYENPTDVLDLYNSTRFERIFADSSYEYSEQLYNPDHYLKHYSHDIGDVINDYAPTTIGTEDCLYVVIVSNLDNFENQTAYFDNIRLTPASNYQEGGIGQKYGMKLDVNLEADANFDPYIDAKIVDYPFIYLEDVYSHDPTESEDKDYEYIVKVYDPTFHKDIYLHYFWSDDEYIHAENNFHEQVITNSYRIDFYIKREELIHYEPQVVIFDLITDLNRLVQLSKIRLDREHIIHTLNMEVSVDNFANHLQIKSLSVEGIGPWEAYETPIGSHQVNLENILGGTIGRSEVILLATSYIWSDHKQTVYVQLGATTDANVYVNDQIIAKINTSVNSLAYPAEGEVELKAGMNKVTVHLMNDDDSKFELRFINTDGTGVLSNVAVLISDNPLNSSPMVTGTFGNGLLTFLGFDYESIVSWPYYDKPLYQLLTNLLISELEHRELFFMSIKQRLLSIIQNAMSIKHQDRNYDWHNADDPFASYSDDQYFEMIAEIQAKQRIVNQLFHRVMVEARTKIGQTLAESETIVLNNLLAVMFHEAGATGTNYYTNGVGSYWYPAEYPYGHLSYTYTDPNYPNFGSKLDYIQTLAMARDALTSGAEECYFMTIQGDAQLDESSRPFSGLAIKEFSYLYSGPPPVTGHAIYGQIRIYGSNLVDVVTDIEDGSDASSTVLMSASAYSYSNPASLLEAFNATFYSMQSFTDWNEQTNHETLLGTISDKIPTANVNVMTKELTIGRNLKSFSENWETKLFLSLFSSAMTTIAAASMVNKKENNNVENEEIEYPRDTTIVQGTKNWYQNGLDKIQEIESDLTPYYMWKYGKPYVYNKMIYGNHFKNIQCSNYFMAPYQNLQLFGESGFPTVLIEDLMMITAAYYRSNPTEEIIIPFNVKGSSISLVAIPSSKEIIFENKKIKPYDEAFLGWVPSDLELLAQKSQSILSLGIFREFNPVLILSKSGPILSFETEIKIDQDQFHNAIQEIMSDENSPYFRGLDIQEQRIQTMLKLNYLGIDDLGNEFFQLVGFHPTYSNDEIETDIIVMKNPTGKYSIAFYREGKDVLFDKATNRMTSKENCFRFNTRPTFNDIKNELDVNSEADICIKKMPFKNQDKDVWLIFRKNSGTTFYDFRNGEAIIIDSNIEIIKSSWDEKELINYKNIDSCLTSNNEYTPYESISAVFNDNNKIITITRTETGNSIKEYLISMLKYRQTYNNNWDVNNNPLHFILPLILLPKLLQRVSLTDYSQLDTIIYTRNNMRKIIGEVYKKFSIEFDIFDYITNSVLDVFAKRGLSKTVVSDYDIKLAYPESKIQKIIDNFDYFLCSGGWSESVFGGYSFSGSVTKNKVVFISEIIKLIHKITASNTESLNEKIQKDYTDKRFAHIRSKLYTDLQRKDAEFIIEIYGKLFFIGLINIYDRWYEDLSHNNAIYMGSGRDNRRDIVDDKYTPLIERAKIFLWMENILATYKTADGIFDGSLPDSSGFLPLTIKSQYINGWGLRKRLGFYTEDIYQNNQDRRGFYIYTQWGENIAVRLLNGAQITGLRANLQAMMNAYLITNGVDIGTTPSINKLAELAGLDDLVSQLIDSEQGYDIYELGFSTIGIPDPYNLDIMLGSENVKMLKKNIEKSQAYPIFSDADLYRSTGRSGRQILNPLSRGLYARRLFRGSTDEGDYTFGDLLIDSNYEMVRDPETQKLKFFKHVTFWDPFAIPKNENCELITDINDPKYEGGSFVTKRIELSEFTKEDILIIDKDYQKKDKINENGKYLVKTLGREIHTLDAAKIPIVETTINGVTKYGIFCSFWKRTNTIQKGTKIQAVTQTACDISEKEKAEFLENTGIKDWMDWKIGQGVSIDDIEICSITNDYVQTMKISQELVEDIYEDLHDNNNMICKDYEGQGYQIDCAAFLPTHSLNQLQYWGNGLHNDIIPGRIGMINTIYKSISRTLDWINDFKNLLRRSEISDENGNFDFIDIQEILRAVIETENNLQKKKTHQKPDNVVGKDPMSDPNVDKEMLDKLRPKTLSQYFIGMSISTFALNQMVNLMTNIRTQLWQSKIIEFASYALQQDTYMMNEWSREKGSNGTYVDLDAEPGYLEKRYVEGESGESASYWKYGEGLILSGLVWITDYIEIGPADCFEYINGMFNGIQLAKVDYGMQPVCMDIPTTIVVALQNFTTEVLNKDLPSWLDNTTKLTSNPAFKTFWFTYLFMLGSTISVITELVKTCTMSTFVGGLAGTGISLAASMLTQKMWVGINTATVNSLRNTGLSDHWTYFQEGDDGLYWKIKAFRVMDWMYCAGSALRPEGIFFETFYLSTYFPNIGSWAGPFDSMLPFIALTTVGVGMILSYMLSLLTGWAIASGALTAGVSLLVIAAAIAYTFIIFRILKACGIFKEKYTEPTIGDDI